MEKSDYPFISVIIPVFNDREPLKLCLAALAQQSYPRSRYEVIAVDNGSDDWEQVQAVVNSFKGVILNRESTPGSYAARNKGLTLAKGEIIAFTDADCIPALDWLEQGVYYLSSTPNCGQVVGQVEIFFANPQLPTSVELYESITAFPQELLLKKFHGGATANVFTWRHVINQVGKFNSKLKSHGDLEWGKRVYDQGYQQVYAESVLVQHPAHKSFPELYNRTRRIAGGYYDLQLEKAKSVWQRQIVFLRALLQDLISPVFFTINLFLDNRLNGIGQKLKVSWVMVLARLISARETIRLKFGGVSNRA